MDSSARRRLVARDDDAFFTVEMASARLASVRARRLALSMRAARSQAHAPAAPAGPLSASLADAAR